jgi:hypothetical protein
MLVAFRPMDSACYSAKRGCLDFLYQRFSSHLRDEACSFRNLQSRTSVKLGDHGSIGDSWPIAFSGCPRGPRVVCETACPKHTAPSLSAETRSRTRVSREPGGHRQRKSQDGRIRSETLKLFVVSDVGPRSLLLSSTPSMRWWQSFWPRSDAPSPVGCPWPAMGCRTPETDPACSMPGSPHP